MPNPEPENFDNLPVGKTAITDRDGNEFDADNPLPVNAEFDTTGLATEAKQDTSNTALANIESQTQDAATETTLSSIDDFSLAIATATANLSKPNTSSLSTVASSGTSQTVLSANSARKEVIIENLSPERVYLRFSANAATTSAGGYTLSLPQYEKISTDFQGEIRCISASAGGSGITVTELTRT